MSQRATAIGVVVIAVIITIFAFIQQQQAAKNEATAVASANTAATAQSQAVAAQQTAVQQMNIQATGQAQAEATRAAAETAAQQSAATAVAALAEATDQADHAAQAQAEATQQAELAAQAQGLADTFAAAATNVQNEANQQATAAANKQATQQSQAAATAAALHTELTAAANQQATQQSQAAATAAALHTKLTAAANEQATQQSQAAADRAAALAQATQTVSAFNTAEANHATQEAGLSSALDNSATQIAAVAATATAVYDSLQATLSNTNTTLTQASSPDETIHFLVSQGIIPADTGELASRLGTTTIDLTGRTNVNKWIYLPGRFADFVLSTDATWGSGVESDHCDIVFRHLDDRNHYIIGINRLGNAFFNAFVAGSWEPGDTTAAPTAIRVEPDTVNRIVVVGVGNNFTLFVNGSLVATYRHTGFPDGQLAVEAGTDQGLKGAGCTFENTWAWDLSAQGLAATGTPSAVVSSGTPFPVPDLTEKYTTGSGTLSFYYSNEWRLSESSDDSVFLYTRGFVPGDFSSLQDGRMVMYVSTLAGADTPDTSRTLSSLAGVLAKGLGDSSDPLTFGDPEPLPVSGHDAFKVVGTSAALGSEIIMYPDNGQYVTVILICSPDEVQTWEPTLLAFAETIKLKQFGLR